MTNKTIKKCSSLASAACVNLFSRLVGDSQQVRTEINVERLIVLYLLLLLAKYSSRES